jgi:hypothetical protein
LTPAGWIRIRIQEGKNVPQKKELSEHISCFEVLDVFTIVGHQIRDPEPELDPDPHLNQ